MPLASNVPPANNGGVSDPIQQCLQERFSLDVFRPSQREVIDSLALPPQLTLRRRIGCAHCKQSGFLGRVVVPEAAFFPDDAVVREQMEAALRSNGNVLDIPGVSYDSREASVASLLAQGVIDIDAARAGLQRHQED